jgi:S-adenosylmethionine:tRNA ribosyltransferase-isomerase
VDAAAAACCWLIKSIFFSFFFRLERVKNMKTDEIKYELPPELFAREPRELHGGDRGASKMLVMKRKTQEVEHSQFPKIGEYLDTGDLIILNNTKTIKAQLFGWADKNKRVDVRLCVEKGDDTWQCLILPAKSVEPGTHLSFDNGALTGTVIEKRKELPLWIVKFDVETRDGLMELLDEIAVPIVPPYAKKRISIDHLQNVYAEIEGSAEMPTAGRHFTRELMEKLEKQGIKFAYVTLHTGLSSIAISEDTFEEHTMYEEKYSISQETADMINNTRESGAHVIGCGTTTIRVLETVADNTGNVKPGGGYTDLYIYPGYTWKIVDKLITNFHPWRTSRIALAAAFTGKELLMEGYRQAIEWKYMFYDYGDSTLTV